jgi:hypothetical protein
MKNVIGGKMGAKKNDSSYFKKDLFLHKRFSGAVS